MYCKQAAIALLLLTGCKQVPTGRQRTAVLRFENLSGADSDWQGRALSELLKRQFTGSPIPRALSSAPGMSTERLAALDAGATRLITGYYTAANGALDVTAFAEDAQTQKLTGPVHVSGNLAQVVSALARQFGASQASPLNANSPAIREYAVASEIAGSAATSHYQAAVTADPSFGPAYFGLMQSDPATAGQTLASASLHASSFAKDPETIRALADAEMTARKPADAAQHYRQAAALEPDNPDLRNLLAYAAMYSGDEAGARAAAAEYARLSPKDPNTLDTKGDVELAFGHFAEAQKDYANTPWKAARARLMSGDAAGATAIFEKLPKSPASGYRAAEWSYLTGNRPEGITAMAAFAASEKQPELRSAAYTQAAIWAVIAHDRARAEQWADLALKPSEQATFLMAALAKFLSRPSLDADRVFQGGNAGPLRDRARGLALYLDGHFDQAAPVWKQVYDHSNVSDVLPMYLYGLSLLKSGHKDQAAPLLRLLPIPSAQIAPSFEALYLSPIESAALRQ